MKQTFEFDKYDMMALKHGLQAVVVKKKRNLQYFKNNEPDKTFNIARLEKDIVREEGLIDILACNIGILNRKQEEYENR